MSRVTIYETLNPGGVSEIELSSKQGNKQVVYQTNGRGASNARQPSGANELTVNFTPVAFDVDYIRIKVDASEMWRGIDYFTVSGLEKQETKLPGELSGASFTFTPNGNKAYGCDEITYIANSGDGWSLPGTLRFCFNGPRNSAGVLCSGHGDVRNALCVCNSAYEGHVCDIPRCPMANGYMCNNVGTCNAGVCACSPGYSGSACQSTAFWAGCRACNDPHYTSFYNAYFDSYGYAGSGWREGELLLAYSPGTSPHVLQVEHYAANLYVDGVAVRYGPDIMSYQFRAGRVMHNCNDIGFGTYNFPTGLSVSFQPWSVNVEIPGVLSMWMNSGCFGMSMLVGHGGQGLCFNNDIRLPMGSCSLSSCHMCQALELAAETERISAKGSEKFRTARVHPWTFSAKFTQDESETKFALESTMISSVENSKSTSKVGGKLRGSTKVKGSKHNSPIQKYAVSLVGVRDTTSGPINPDKIPAVITECPQSLIRAAMSLKNCLKFLGTIMFDDCLMDTCLIAAGDKTLTPEQVIAKADEMNAAAAKNRLMGHEAQKDLREQAAEIVNVVKKENEA